MLANLGRLVADHGISDAESRQRLAQLLAINEQRRPPSKSQIARDRMIEAIRPVRGLLASLVELPWHANSAHPVMEAMTALRGLYDRRARAPHGITPHLGSL